jgi:hypothetical protein
VTKKAEDMLPYKEYSALLTQSGTGDPVATILSNDTGNTIAWSRIAPGLYLGTFGTAIDNTKAQAFAGINSAGDTVSNVFFARIGTGAACSIGTFKDNLTQEDDLLSKTPFVLRIYP